MKRDMANLKKHGFNLIKLQEHWQTDEATEGQYDFAKYEELIEHAQGLDMGVYIGLTCEQAPAWLWIKHPGCRMVGLNGLPIAYEAQCTLPCDGKPGPCYDDPGAMADQVRFIKKLVGVLGKHENVVIWNTWQEIGYWSEGLAGQPVCYCANTLNAFRNWLMKKFGDLDNLNRAWNTRYSAWEYIAPDRCHGKYPLALNVEWQYFMTDINVANVLRTRAQAIKEADPLKRPVFAHKGAPVIGSGQDWAYARCQDFLGSSCYPAWFPHNAWDDWSPNGGKLFGRHQALLGEIWDSLALRFDYIRSCNRPNQPIWAAEFQGGPTNVDLARGRMPVADDIRRWMLTAVGAGVTGISFWITRAEIIARETNGFSLLDSEGDSTPRYEEAARVGAALNRHADIFGNPLSKPRAKAAILINEANYQLCGLMTPPNEILCYSVRGWHRFLWEAGIPVDFVEVAELDQDYAKEYKTFILPFPLLLSETVAGKLARWVEQGGQLISEAGPGRLSEYAFANRGELSPIMRSLFGVRHTGFARVAEPAGGKRWSATARTWGDYIDATKLKGAGPLAGHSLRANFCVETFACEGKNTKPCLMHGKEIAGIVRQAGKGRAWLLGTLTGPNGTAYRDNETRKCIITLLKQCGIVPEHNGKLLLSKHVNKDKEAWIFTNKDDRDVSEEIDVKGWKKVEDLLAGPLKVQSGRIKLKVKSLDVKVLIVSGK
ncbi:MAG: beta-galactosidase [Kiritimatiellaeota bacterium]|nr:beta-galactosidase [Kiritimatiellota bacterium]